MNNLHSSSLSSKTNPIIYVDGKNIGKNHGTGVYYYTILLFETLKTLNYTPIWLLEQTSPHHVKNSLRTILYALFGRRISTFLRFLPHRFSEQCSLEKSSSAQTPAQNPPHNESFLCPDLYRIAHLHFRYYQRLLFLSPPPGSPPFLMQWTYPLPLLMKGCPNLVTIHDLIPLTHPALTGIHTERYRALITALVQHGAHFVTVSETIRQEFLSLFAVAPDRVTTLYQLVEFDAATRKSIQTAPSIAPADSFIFYGRIESRKNIDRLLEAHALSRTTRPLILIGPDGDDHPNCTPRGPTSTVIRLPWSERFSLLRCLAQAHALVFPTLAEGFGLPIIEAMALGTAVITSKGGVTEEIAGGAALLVDPLNVESLAHAFTTLDKMDRESSDYKMKQEAGYHRAEFFSATRYAQRLKTLYSRFSPDNSDNKA